MLSWSTPHNPYHQLPERWYRVYDPERLKLPPNTSDMPENRRDLAGYYAHISALDECLGRLLDGLVERGLDQDTIVVFTSDHGLRIRPSVTQTARGCSTTTPRIRINSKIRSMSQLPPQFAQVGGMVVALGGPLSGRCLLCRALWVWRRSRQGGAAHL